MKKFVLLLAIILFSAYISAVASQAQTVGKRERAAGRKAKAPAVLRVGPSSTYLKNGLSADEVVRLLGTPVLSTAQRSGESLLATLTFERGEGRVLVAEFVNGLLVSSHTQTSENIAQR